MTNKEEIELELALAQMQIAVANAARAKANAELAQEEVVHERAKIKKTEAETSSASKKGWKEILEGFAAIALVGISVASFFWAKKR